MPRATPSRVSSLVVISLAALLTACDDTQSPATDPDAAMSLDARVSDGSSDDAGAFDGSADDASEPSDAQPDGQALDGASSDASDASDASTDASSDAAPFVCMAVAPTSCPAPAPTYANVAPIFKQRCVGCHAANWTGPWPLDTYGHIADWADDVRSHLLDCTMPPPESGMPIPFEESQQILTWLRCGLPM